VSEDGEGESPSPGNPGGAVRGEIGGCSLGSVLFMPVGASLSRADELVAAGASVGVDDWPANMGAGV